MLELGCGDGANTLSLAAALPGAQFLGIDAAASAIARGSELARAAGLRNARLLCADLEDLPGELGSFDYVIAHGVYSWIPPRVRGALLACCRAHLNPHGIAFVSYNAYPGSYLRDMTRDILLYHLRAIEDPAARLAGAQELMRTIVAIEAPSPYAQALREQLERMLRYSDALLFHDDLAEISTPFYFHEFAAHAAAHGLQFLAEAELADSQMRDVPDSAARLMAALPEDVVVREQYLDFFRNRMFRQTLLCHAEAPVRRTLEDRALEAFAFSSPARPHEGEGEEEAGALPADGPDQEPGETFLTPEGFTITTSELLVAAAMRALGQAWPAAPSFAELLAVARAAAGPEVSAELVAQRLRAVLLEAHLARIVQLYGCASALAARPSEHPRASALARAQSAAGAQTVSSLLHANARLEGALEPRLLALLDGTRDRAALLDALGGEADGELLEATLTRFAALGLLQA